MSSISFFDEDITFKLSQITKTKDWIRQIIIDQGYNLVSINYIFCSDQYLHKINLQYLSHDTYTDIVTFDQSDNELDIEADIYISTERVKENSQSLKTPFEEELRRVMIHGILHLLGYSDKTQDQKVAMRKKEDSCLSLYFN
jgi:rRNA maturation RNase YbeY